MSRECCLRLLRQCAASTRPLGGGAGWGPLCWTRTGPSYTTCEVPARNGEKSTRAALAARTYSDEDTSHWNFLGPYCRQELCRARDDRTAAWTSMEWACSLYSRRTVVRHCLLVRGFVRRACLNCGIAESVEYPDGGPEDCLIVIKGQDSHGSSFARHDPILVRPRVVFLRLGRRSRCRRRKTARMAQEQQS
jgi:hypothetical protein